MKTYTIFTIVDYKNTTGEEDRNTIHIENTEDKKAYLSKIHSNKDIIIQTQEETASSTIITGHLAYGWQPNIVIIIKEVTC